MTYTSTAGQQTLAFGDTHRDDTDQLTVWDAQAEPEALRCFGDPHWHRAHTWTYGGRQVACDGMPDRTRRDRAETEGRCCADPLCPCDTKPGWSTGLAGSMNATDLHTRGAD